MKSLNIALGLVIAAMTLGIVAANAHKNATGVVKERMDLMKALGKEMKSLKKILSTAPGKDKEKAILSAADAIGKHAKEMTALFPKGSMDHPTEAKKEIWETWTKFQSAADELSNAAKLLAAGAEKEKEAANAFEAIAKSCKNCHQDYREKKK